MEVEDNSQMGLPVTVAVTQLIKISGQRLLIASIFRCSVAGQLLYINLTGHAATRNKKNKQYPSQLPS